MNEIATWLEKHDLGMYAPTFEANDIDFSALRELTDIDLRELGLSLGHRRKLLRAIRELTEQSGDPARSGEAERRHISILFADVVGYTALSQRLDPEELLEAIRAYQEACAAVIRRYGGMVAKYVGDGVVAFFGWPYASEHDAHNAVRSGLAIIDGVKGIRTKDGEPLRVRVGIATGLAVVGDLTSDTPDVLGDVPNLAERLQAAAKPDQIVVAGTTHRLVAAAMDCEPLGDLTLKGFERPVPAWRIAGERQGHATPVRHAAPSIALVDRKLEMGELRQIWADVCRSNIRTVCIRAEAGIGKSRVVSEFFNEIRETAEIISFYGLPDAGQSALRPIVSYVENLAGFKAGDDPAVRLEKIEAMLGHFSLDRRIHAPIFSMICGLPIEGNGLTGISAERQKAMLFEGIGSTVKQVAKGRPLAVVFEDLHWLDPTTVELAAYLTGAQGKYPVLILITTRPEAVLPFGSETAARVIELPRLDNSDATKLLRLQSGTGGELDEAVAERILERSGGVPLYIEELTKSAVEMRGDDRAIPFTLQDSLMARLDRLGNARRITQMASVIGLDFSASLLAASLDLPISVVVDSLDRLVEENILSRDRNSNGEEPAYKFRHVLLAEAAYESQLRRTRQAAHATVAEALLNRFPKQAEAAPQAVARHLEAAGRHAEASPLFRKAGLTALRQAHYHEALGLFQAALAGLEHAEGEGSADDPAAREVKLEILTEIGTARIALEGFGAPGVGEIFDKAEALGRMIGPGPALARALWGAWLFQLVSGNLERAVAIAKELLALGQGAADALGDTGLLMEAKWALGDTLFWLAQFDPAHRALRDSIALFDPAAHGDHATLYGQDPYVAAHCYDGYTQWARSDHDSSFAALKAAVARARAIDHPFSVAWALCFGPVVATWRNEAWVAKRLSEAALAHTEKQIMPFWQSAMTIVHGWARLRCGQPREGVEEAMLGLEQYRAIGSETVQPFFRGLVGECLRIVGDYERADEMIKSGFETARRTGERFSEMWLHIFAARLRVAMETESDEAKKELQNAIEIARGTGAVELELTAAVELAHLLPGKERAAWVGPALARAVAPRKSRAGRRAIAIMEAADT